LYSLSAAAARALTLRRRARLRAEGWRGGYPGIPTSCLSWVTCGCNPIEDRSAALNRKPRPWGRMRARVYARNDKLMSEPNITDAAVTRGRKHCSLPAEERFF
jgi:hypothetical protein